MCLCIFSENAFIKRVLKTIDAFIKRVLNYELNYEPNYEQGRMFSHFAKTGKKFNFYEKPPVHKKNLTSRVLTQPRKF